MITEHLYEGQIGSLKPLGMGVYIDEGHQLHFDVPEFLAENGLANTGKNREVAMRAMIDACKRKNPTVPCVLSAADSPRRN